MIKRKKSINNVRFFKKELKNTEEIKNIKRRNNNIIDIELSNDINIALDFSHKTAFVVVTISYDSLELRKEGITGISDLEELINQFKSLSQNFLNKMISLKQELSQIFFYDMRFYFHKNTLAVIFDSNGNSAKTLYLKFNDDIIKAKLVYNIETDEINLKNVLQEIKHDKNQKIVQIKNIVENIFKKVVVDDSDYLFIN